jgi:hypothetical protein
MKENPPWFFPLEATQNPPWFPLENVISLDPKSRQDRDLQLRHGNFQGPGGQELAAEKSALDTTRQEKCCFTKKH